MKPPEENNARDPRQGQTDTNEHTTTPGPREEFYRELHAAFLAAGPPTYARLVAIMQKRAKEEGRAALGSSALQAMMNGRGKLLPHWATLSATIHALRTAATETGLDPETVGTVQGWHQRLLQASEKIKTARRR